MAFLIAGQVYVAQSLFKSQAYASSNITATGAAEETNPDTTLSFPTNPTGNFNATGSISSLVASNNRTTADAQYVLSGNWNVLASNGNITDFSASLHFIMRIS